MHRFVPLAATFVLLLAIVTLGGCASSSGSDSAAFERTFIGHCRDGGNASDYCACVFNSIAARASDAGKNVQDYKPSGADFRAAAADCR